MTPLHSRLSQIQARLEAATPGPWEVFGLPNEDAELIAHAPADLAFLTAALKVAIEALQADRGKTINDHNAAELFWRMSLRHQAAVAEIERLAGGEGE